MRVLRRMIFCCGVLMAPVLLVLAGIAFLSSASLTGWLYLGSFVLAAIGCLYMPANTRTSLSLIAGAIVLFIGTMVIRYFSSSNALVEVIQLGDPDKKNFYSHIIDEQDGAVPIAFAYYATGRLPREDAGRFYDGLAAAYDRMDAAVGPVPTPAVMTYLNRQKVDHFETVIIPPTMERLDNKKWPKTAVIFLHGLGGNFTVYCWQAAEAARAIAAVTLCPSTSPRGNWWELHGIDTVRATIAQATLRGVERIYLMGFSHGGIGAAEIALHTNAALRGLIIVSGSSQKSPAPNIPALIVHGEKDTLADPTVAKAYARAGQDRTELVMFEDGGHFIFLEQHEEVTRAIASWLRKHDDAARAKTQ